MATLLISHRSLNKSGSCHLRIERPKKPSIVILAGSISGSKSADAGSLPKPSNSQILLHQSGMKSVPSKRPEVSIFVVKGGKACEAFRRPKHRAGDSPVETTSIPKKRKRVQFRLGNAAQPVGYFSKNKPSTGTRAINQKYIPTFQSRPVCLSEIHPKSAITTVESIQHRKFRTTPNNLNRNRAICRSILQVNDNMAKSNLTSTHHRNGRMYSKVLLRTNPKPEQLLLPSALGSRCKVSNWIDSNFERIHDSNNFKQGGPKKRPVFTIKTKSIVRIITDLLKVDKLPQASEGYPTLPENSYGSPSNFNCPKLGSQRFDAPPPPALPVPNLPSGIQLTKRAAPATDAVHVPPKISRGDNGMPRLPGGITLVKSPRAPPPKNNMVDLLANRGVSMVSKTVSPAAQRNLNQSVSIQPVSPAKRLPNLPPGISISSSRPQSSSYSNVQGFAVPPTPPRGRQVTNMETVDLTRNNANRMQGGRPPMAPPMGAGNRSATCTICDKVFPSPELLKNHMTVHGGQVSRGRFMCEICRVIYPNEAKLAHHKRTVHAKPASAEATGPEFVIPICDISQNGVKQKLLQCGIRHIVQMSSLRNANDTATFGLPIIPIDLARNEAFSRLDDLGASNILSLGTLKTITH